jgi:hypothetical protein
MIIVGAGMAGLLAANMLHRHNPQVMELQSKLPNNHSAVLRFRSPVVGDVLGIPFKKVSMIKASVPWNNPVSDALAYSFKCTGQYLTDRSIIAGLKTEERYIAPEDLISRMSSGLKIKYDTGFTKANDLEPPIISTLPMPILMHILEWKEFPDFQYIGGINVRAIIDNCDAYCSLLVPDPNNPASRISLTGNELIIELPRCGNYIMDHVDLVIKDALELLGLSSNSVNGITIHKQSYHKIAPIADKERKTFISWATEKHGIYSLGRYATWRPNLLLDDLVNDVRLIEGWIGNAYDAKKHWLVK